MTAPQRHELRPPGDPAVVPPTREEVRVWAVSKIIEAVHSHAASHGARCGRCDLCERWAFYQSPGRSTREEVDAWAISQIIRAVRSHANFHSVRRGECTLCEAWIFYVQAALGEPDRARAERLEWLV